MNTFFLGSRLKIKRANKHIDELATLLNNFQDSDFYRLTIKKDSETGFNFLKVETGDLPSNLPLIIGDALHNLKSALDILAFEIVTRANKLPSTSLYFPCRKSRKELIRALKDTEINVASPAIIDVLLNTITPDSGEGEYNPLWALKTLDITDKHRLLIPVISRMTISGVCAQGPNITITNDTYILRPGSQLQPIGIQGDFQVTDHGKAIVEIAFHEAGVFEGQAIIPTLNQLSQFILGIVEAVEKTYIAP